GRGAGGPHRSRGALRDECPGEGRGRELQDPPVRRLAAVIGLALWAVAGRGSAGAAERGPVPSFTVFGLDGTPAASMEFAGHGSRVLLYVRPGSAHARELLRLLASDE